MSNFSIYFAFGKKGWGYEKDDKSIHIRIGFMTICIIRVDIEDILGNLLSELKDKDGQEEDLLKREKVLNVNTELYNKKKEALDKKINDYRGETSDLKEEIEWLKEAEAGSKKRIDELEMEIATLEDLSDDNDDLQNEISNLEKSLKKECFNVKCIKTYFRLR